MDAQGLALGNGRQRQWRIVHLNQDAQALLGRHWRTRKRGAIKTQGRLEFGIALNPADKARNGRYSHLDYGAIKALSQRCLRLSQAPSGRPIAGGHSPCGRQPRRHCKALNGKDAARRVIASSAGTAKAERQELAKAITSQDVFPFRWRRSTAPVQRGGECNPRRGVAERLAAGNGNSRSLQRGGGNTPWA